MRIDDELVRSSVAALVQTDEPRDVARWEMCKAVCDSLDDYRPDDCPVVPSMLRTYTTATLIEALPNNQDTALAFGAFRAQVTDVEAINARRLGVLATVKLQLEEMRPRAAHRPELIDHMLQRLGFFMRGAWRVEVPSEARRVRLWASRVTRRYDVLPREWREL